jgi:hypothetical protein
MTKRIERSTLRKIHYLKNPEISYELFEWNYGWNEVEKGNTLQVLENGQTVLQFSNAHAYYDRRKPNERQTTD